MPEDGGLIGQALIGLKPMNAWVHTYTKPQTSSTRSRGLGRRIHESVEDTKLSTNKQHSLFFTFAGAGVLELNPKLLQSCSLFRISTTKTHVIVHLYHGGVLRLLPVYPSRCSLLQVTNTDVAYPHYCRSCPCDPHDLLPPLHPCLSPDPGQVWVRGNSCTRPSRLEDH